MEGCCTRTAEWLVCCPCGKTSNLYCDPSSVVSIILSMSVRLCDVRIPTASPAFVYNHSRFHCENVYQHTWWQKRCTLTKTHGFRLFNDVVFVNRDNRMIREDDHVQWYLNEWGTEWSWPVSRHSIDSRFIWLGHGVVVAYFKILSQRSL